jgi:SOS-response transcriptional repressor LexA
MSTEFGKRVRAARKLARLSQVALARAVGLTQGTISEMETLAHSSTATAQIAETCGVSAHWLATGDGEMVPSIQTSNVKFSGVDPIDLAFTGGVPLISWVQAGSWSDVADPYVVGDAEDWLPCPVRHGPRTYCLRVRGDSMYNPSGRPSYYQPCSRGLAFDAPLTAPSPALGISDSRRAFWATTLA